MYREEADAVFIQYDEEHPTRIYFMYFSIEKNLI